MVDEVFKAITTKELTVSGFQEIKPSSTVIALKVTQEQGANGVFIDQKSDYYGLNVSKDISGSTYGVARIIQNHISGGAPVLILDQDDVSEGFIEFTGSDRGIVATSSGNSVASFRVELNGTKYLIPLFTDA